MTRTLSLRSLDIPSVHKFGIGFDSVFDEFMKMSEQQTNFNYPPFNIVKQTDDKYYIEVAVAGFGEGEVTVNLDNRYLTITGTKLSDPESQSQPEYLHRGISNRSFVREFRLGEFVEVLDAQTKDGILTIYLERQVPEANKPKTIDIKYLK